MPNAKSAKAIKRLVSGETPSLIDADKGNELIDAVNQLLSLTISPQGFGKLIAGDKGAILDLTPLRNIFEQLGISPQAFTTTTPTGAGGGNGNSFLGIINQVAEGYNQLLGALASSTLHAECDAVTRVITVTWTINLPPPVTYPGLPLT